MQLTELHLQAVIDIFYKYGISCCQTTVAADLQSYLTIKGLVQRYLNEKSGLGKRIMNDMQNYPADTVIIATVMTWAGEMVKWDEKCHFYVVSSRMLYEAAIVDNKAIAEDPKSTLHNVVRLWSSIIINDS